MTINRARATAGVIGYIDRQLSGKFRDPASVYREGIAAANRLAGGVFADCAGRPAGWK